MSESDPAATPDAENPGLGSTTGLGGAGIGATPQRSSDWDSLGLGSTAGLGATPGPSETPSSAGGLEFVSASSDGPKKVSHSKASFPHCQGYLGPAVLPEEQGV